MTGRTQGLGSFFAALFILALIVATLAAMWGASLQAQPAAAPAPTPTADRSDYWAQQVQDATDGLQAAQTALTSQPVTHQSLSTLLKDCRDRVTAFNATAAAAGPYWAAYIQHPINANQECKAPR